VATAVQNVCIDIAQDVRGSRYACRSVWRGKICSVLVIGAAKLNTGFKLIFALYYDPSLPATWPFGGCVCLTQLNPTVWKLKLVILIIAFTNTGKNCDSNCFWSTVLYFILKNEYLRYHGRESVCQPALSIYNKSVVRFCEILYESTAHESSLSYCSGL
jgi:hypothetical protein